MRYSFKQSCKIQKPTFTHTTARHTFHQHTIAMKINYVTVQEGIGIENYLSRFSCVLLLRLVRQSQLFSSILPEQSDNWYKLMRLIMDLTALWDMWRQFGNWCHLFSVLILLLCSSLPPHTFQSLISASETASRFKSLWWAVTLKDAKVCSFWGWRRNLANKVSLLPQI